MSIERLKISVSGVRGVVGESLSPKLITSFAAAFGEYVGHGRVVVGRDTRPSGEMYESAVVAGLLSVGCQPVLIGVVPTPTVQIMVDDLNANGGIAITASHNPSEWNALKFVGASGMFLDYTEAQELQSVYNQQQRGFVNETDFRNLRYFSNAFRNQQKRIFDLIDIELIRKAKLRVVCDCCNGAGALYSKKFLEDLGCEVFTIFDETDGIFRRRPEPIPENLTKLSEAVVEHKCDIGFAQDPDADRIVMVDSDGRPIGEQYSLVLVAEHLLANQPNSSVTVNIQTTKAVEDVAKKYNSTVIYTPVGEINVTSKLLESNSIIGGEGGSGGVIWPAVHPCRDSYTGMALVLEMMAQRQHSLKEILATIPQYCSYGMKIPCSGSKAAEITRVLKARYANLKPNTIDGLRIDWDDHWLLIRASNTEPIIRIFVEAPSMEKAKELAHKFAAELNSIES